MLMVVMDKDQIVEGEFRHCPYRIYDTADGLARDMYQRYEVEVRDKYWQMNGGDVIVDIGSMYGEYAILGLLTGAAKAYCFDPYVEAYSYTRRVAELNGLSPDRICIHKLMLSNTENMLDDWGLPVVDWIKVDVEGMELEVLKGAERTIQKTKPNLLVELHHFKDPEIEPKVVRYVTETLGYAADMLTIEPYHLYFAAGNDASHLFARGPAK